MTKLLRLFLVMTLAATLSACGDDSSSDENGGNAGMSGDGDADAGGDGDGDGDAGGDGDGDGDGFLAPAAEGWLNLITGDWELPAETESYRCVRLTIPEDTFVSGMKPLSPPGTHHTVLSIDPEPTAPDGITTCTAFDNGVRQIGGSGVGTGAYEYPDGVAMELKQGSQITLNLHLFNTGDEPLTGTSGLLIKTRKASEVEEVAETILAGPLDLEIPPGRVTQSGTCTFSHDATIFSVLPHMHQTGVYMKVVANSSLDGEVTLFDDDYDFDRQEVYVLAPMVRMQEGDTIDVECTYENKTDETIRWGDSSLAEMCFAGLARFPAGDAMTACAQ